VAFVADSAAAAAADAMHSKRISANAPRPLHVIAAAAVRP